MPSSCRLPRETPASKSPRQQRVHRRAHACLAKVAARVRVERPQGRLRHWGQGASAVRHPTARGACTSAQPHAPCVRPPRLPQGAGTAPPPGRLARAARLGVWPGALPRHTAPTREADCRTPMTPPPADRPSQIGQGGAGSHRDAFGGPAGPEPHARHEARLTHRRRSSPASRLSGAAGGCVPRLPRGAAIASTSSLRPRR
jgi:hypothetical protein